MIMMVVSIADIKTGYVKYQIKKCFLTWDGDDNDSDYGDSDSDDDDDNGGGCDLHSTNENRAMLNINKIFSGFLCGIFIMMKASIAFIKQDMYYQIKKCFRCRMVLMILMMK